MSKNKIHQDGNPPVAGLSTLFLVVMAWAAFIFVFNANYSSQGVENPLLWFVVTMVAVSGMVTSITKRERPLIWGILAVILSVSIPLINLAWLTLRG